MEPAFPGIKTTTPGEQPGLPSTKLTLPGMGPALPGIKITTPEEQPESPCTQTVTPELQPGSPGMSHLKVPVMPWGSSASSRASDYGMGTVDALCHFGQLGHLKEQVSHLEAMKSDHTEHEEPHLLFPEGACGQWPSNLGLSPQGSQPPLAQHTTLSPSLPKQDEEVLKRIQTTIVQVQGNYEKLNSIMGTLLHNSQQQQKDTKALFQSLEKLVKEKADKNDLVLGLDVKADKTTLASKVNRSEFDTRMERLTDMVKEMLSRQMDQEKVQQQLSEEVASKLDHLELGSLRKQLEGHWKNIQEQLQKESQAEADDAAGTKSPLTRFHCLSCDRPLDMRVPGP
ncbi:glutamine-rich protein 2 [Limosa lapponica baueri]|uniref:Glutamine-rich protein 2 n=1 Tax=Limosa lapponica baueri TaxID=1758121 RepID=A0A2I0T9B3_LIMLA|nr:glutamine-rich protein 2 [Limosa lapponica baueri]